MMPLSSRPSSTDLVPMTILPSQRDRFDIPRDVAYLNCAYMSPLLRHAVEVGKAALAKKTRPWDIAPGDFFTQTDQARAVFARLLGGPARADDVAIVPAASYGMAVACRNTPIARGQRVLALDEEFPSTILSWRERAREAGADFVLLPRPADDDWTRVVLAAIDQRTAAAALPHCHWIDGARLDLAAIGAKLRAVGAVLALDLTQSLGAMPLDLAAVDPDFLVAACYKWLLGPYSTGFLYVAPRRQDGVPLEHSWFSRGGAENFSGLTDYREDFAAGARRYDVGEPSNFALLPPTVAALEQLMAWGIGSISETAGALAGAIVGRGMALGLTAVPTELRAPHYVGLRRATGFPADLVTRLAGSRVYVSVRGGRTLRITPHVYNDAADVDRLFEALTAALSASVA